MTIGLMKAPFPITYRELWLPPGINNHATLPTSVQGGHEFALTGARKGTTADGVHGTGANTSNINCGANLVDDAAVKYWVWLRFRPDIDWTTGDGDQYLWGKFVDVTHFIRARLDSATGNLVFEKDEGGAGFVLSIASPDGDGIWHAGTLYKGLFSISNTEGARFKVNDADLQTDVDANPMPNGGDLCFLDFDDPGAGTGFVGVEADIFCGIDDLTAAEEDDLEEGVCPDGAVHLYPLDEGRGVTAYDRGSGADNGTLDTSPTWSFGQVQQPTLSLAGTVVSQGTSSAGIDISGDTTLVWVGKIKCTYYQIANRFTLIKFTVDANNYYRFLFPINTSAHLQWEVRAGGVTVIAGNIFGALVLDDYMIIIATVTQTGNIALYCNGSLLGTNTGAGILPVGGATAYVGFDAIIGRYDPSDPLRIALIDGAFTQKQALTYSRYMRNVFNMPIPI